MSRLPAAEDYVKLYTDGACSGNPGPGGWAFILEHPATGKVLERFGAEAHTTNNRMEIEGALRGLEILKRPCRVELVTDSQYLAKGINEWLPGWRANGYRRREGNKLKPLVNDDLWRAVDALLARHQVRVVHVRGHAGHPQNERCDQLAVAAYKSLGRKSASGSTPAGTGPRPPVAPVTSVQERSWPSDHISEPELPSIPSVRPVVDSVKSAQSHLISSEREELVEEIESRTKPKLAEKKAAGSAAPKKPRAQASRSKKASTPKAAEAQTPVVTPPSLPAVSLPGEETTSAKPRKVAKPRATPKKRTTAKRQPEIEFPDSDGDAHEPARWDPDEV